MNAQLLLDGDEVRRLARWTMLWSDPELDQRARLINHVAHLLYSTGNLDAVIVAGALEAIAADLMERLVVELYATETLQ
jgi:adenylylsulfate kinase-like enzyme